MRLISLICAVGLSLISPLAAASATTWVAVTKECPVGGKKFMTHDMASNSYFGQRPDGRPYSPSPIPPIVECPDNGFVIFQEQFSKDEITKLTQLVASAEYQSLRNTDSAHYRAWWLMEHIDSSSYDLALRLMYASWESEFFADRRPQYLAQFAEAALKLEYSEENREDWFWLRLRAANALRETGRFDEANAAIDSTYIPDRLPRGTDDQEAAKDYVEGLRALNRDRNSHAEPANLIPPAVAAQRCQAADISPAEVAACGSAAVKEAIDEQRSWQEHNVGEDDAAAEAAEAAKEAIEAFNSSAP